VTAPTQAETPITSQPSPAQYECLSLLIHAGSKIGKSTLSATAPCPILVLDAEGSWRFIPLRKVYWDPFTGPPPQYDGTWDACVVHVRMWETVQMAYAYLTQWPHSFVSVVVDSITEIQRRCKENLKGTEALRIQDWGVLLSRMDAVIRGFRDLTLMPGLAVRCVVFVAETRETSGKWRPYMQGQIAVSLPYWVDICGYLFPTFLQDGNGQATQEVRQLLITPLDPRYEAGERVQGRLGSVITIAPPVNGQVGTDIADMFVKIYGHTATGRVA
jgi:hypothetical protein